MNDAVERVLEIPQDAEPGLANIIALGTETTLLRQIRDWCDAAVSRGTPEAGSVLRAAARLARALEAEPIAGPPTARDIALLALGKAVGRWEAVEEDKGGVIPARRQIIGQKAGAHATRKAKAQAREEDAAKLRAEVEKKPPHFSHTHKLLSSAETLGWMTPESGRKNRHSVATLRDMCPTPTNKKGPKLPA